MGRPPKNREHEHETQGNAMETQENPVQQTKRYDRESQSDPLRNAPLNALDEKQCEISTRGMKWGRYASPSYENSKRIDLPYDILDANLNYRWVYNDFTRIRQVEAAGWQKVPTDHFDDKDVPIVVTPRGQSASEKQTLRLMAIPKSYYERNQAIKNADRRKKEIATITNEDGKGFLEGGNLKEGEFYAPQQSGVSSGIKVKEYSY